MNQDNTKNKLNISLLLRNQRHEQTKQITDVFHNKQAGFTLLELITIILIIAVLSAIAAPGWLGFVSKQRLNKASDGLMTALQDAQREAKQKKLTYSASFRLRNNIPEYIIHEGTTVPSTGIWNKVSSASELQPGQVLLYSNLTPNPNPTVVGQSQNTKTADAITLTVPISSSQTISFDYLGALARKSTANADTPLKIMVASPNTNNTQASGSRRCVIIDNLIGGMATKKDSDCN
jgi:type II secretory pathway pseudopilin PulG